MRKNLSLLLLAIFASACTAPPPVTSAQPAKTPKPTPLPATMPCMVINPAVTPQPVLGAEMGDRGHSIGAADAPVTIVMFGDYQCASCAYLASILDQIREAHPVDVRIVYLHFPLAAHDKAALTIQAAEAADLQGKFWEMHTLLFEKQAEWLDLPPAEFPSWTEQQAGSLGMDVGQFHLDFQGQVVAKRVKQAADSTTGIQQLLPILFVNSSTPYAGRVDFSGLDQVVRLLAMTKQQLTACPPMIIKTGKAYTATLHTAKGDVVLELYTDQSTLAVNNFIFLSRAHWYDGNTFFRVVPGVLAQTGDPSDTGLGNPGYFFATDILPGLSFDRPGRVAMANTGPGTNGSQFFITLAAAPEMNGQYTIFGQVVTGMDVMMALTSRDPNPGQAPPPGDELISVVVSEP